LLSGGAAGFGCSELSAQPFALGMRLGASRPLSLQLSFAVLGRSGQFDVSLGRHVAPAR
jgi:hypothetical protein